MVICSSRFIEEFDFENNSWADLKKDGKTLLAPIFDDAHNTQLDEGGVLNYANGKVGRMCP